MTVSERMQSRLKNVPGVTSEDIGDWIAEAIAESEITEAENASAVFYLALAIAYDTIAANTAHYFSYTDGEESVNKTNVYANYEKLAANARKNYRKYKRGNGASASYLKRADDR